jgi:hypothetical protein
MIIVNVIFLVILLAAVAGGIDAVYDNTRTDRFVLALISFISGCLLLQLVEMF